MESCRAIRYLKPDPVPEELIRKLVYAATRASNPGNSQGWEFLILQDSETKKRLRDALAEVMLPAIDAMAVGEEDVVQQRIFAGARHLVDHFDAVPVLIFVCGRNIYPPDDPDECFVGSTVYPAAQNLIVAARALGLGTTFTTLHMVIEPVVREVLGIPPEVFIGVTIAVGYPDQAFGPVKRRPIDEVLHWDAWS